MSKKIDIDGAKYTDLPLDVRRSIEKIIVYRKGLDLPDDTEDRKQRAIRYFVFQRGKE
jgi:hypothetical protein